MTEDEKKQYQDLHKDLMVLQGQYDDLLKGLTKWQKRFYEYYRKINGKLNGE